MPARLWRVLCGLRPAFPCRHLQDGPWPGRLRQNPYYAHCSARKGKSAFSASNTTGRAFAIR